MVEIMTANGWMPILRATAMRIESNRWYIRFQGVPMGGLTSYDGQKFRINRSLETFRAWGTRLTNGTLTLDCLVQ